MRRFASKLYNWVALMIILGALLGHFFPAYGVALQPVADGFINLIKMLIPPVILCTVVSGIAGAGSIRKAGRVGGKAILYFEVVSTFALVIGVVMAHVFAPGKGFHADPSKLDPRLVAGSVTQAQHMTISDHLLKMIPKTFFSAFTEGDILQVLLVSVLLGFALARLTDTTKVPLLEFLERVNKLLFGVMRLILFTAPLGAGAAIAFTIGKFGLKSLLPMGALILVFYLTCAVFIFFILGTIARLAGFNILRLLNYIKSELLLVLATSSSESALILGIDKFMSEARAITNHVGNCTAAQC